MRTKRTYFTPILAVCAVVIGFTLPAKSQISLDSYYNIDWQFNIPVNDFAKKASGYGMNFDAGWYVSPDFAIGAFLSYHTNNEYVSRRTIDVNSTTTVYTDQQRSLYQVPFGATALYRFIESDWQPYVCMKLGAEYAQLSSYYYIYESSKNTWGFYMSPEVGVRFYPWANGIGFHLAAYYSFSTNEGKVMGKEMKTVSNFGVRLGLAF